MQAVKALFGSGALLLATLSPGVSAQCDGLDSEAVKWLDMMANSSRAVSYHGVMTLQRGSDMQVVQVSHLISGENSQDVMTQLTGQGAQVHQDHPLHCEHPGQDLMRIGDRVRAGDCGIAAQYRFSVNKGDRVAGRRSVQIRVEPRDMYRYGYVMSLDRKTGLLLKTETLGHGERQLERFQFANLQINSAIPNSASEVELKLEASHPHPDHAGDSAALANPWQVRWLPPGFTLTDAVADTQARRTYTDGLAAFSVFIEDLDHPIEPGEGLVRKGGTTSYTRGMEVDARPMLVTVLGEVPVNTARMVADSVNWSR
ncbi:MAG: negative regulator for alginate biosynthesis [Halioglobus sp.]|nr:negative regulator for alginate biosynthesis [Halioglobus sp.]